jgi:hypothetical protein
MKRTLIVTGVAPVLTALLMAPAAAEHHRAPTLVGRAILPADAYQEGPPSGALVPPNNGVFPPFPSQPLPGFSALLDAGHGEFWAMPDNGYGTKANSADFLLRIYRIAPDFKTARGGSGDMNVLGYVQLSDPDHQISFPITRADRLLTGADLDLESVRQAKDGTFWFGEEFGPFLVHTDVTGRVLEPPIQTPDTQSPQNPFLANPNAWTLPASRGFEGMALSKDGKTLYPANEGALRADMDQHRRIIHAFDIPSRTWSDQTWSYRTDADFRTALIGDMTAVDQHRLVVIERDGGQGVDARQKKVYLVDLREVDEDGNLVKRLVLDLLSIQDPDGVSLPARPGEYGVGLEFSFPLESVEAIEVLEGERLAVANDNNYPNNDGRWIARDRPDDTEVIIVHAPALR